MHGRTMHGRTRSLHRPSSPPSRGAWIEIRAGLHLLRLQPESPPSRGAWIEIGGSMIFARISSASPPSRGAWIEILPSAGGRTSRSRRPPRGGRGLKWCCPSQMACCSPFSFIVSFLFPLYILRSKNRPIIPLHSTQRTCPPRRAPEASGAAPSLRLLQLAHDLLAHHLLRILRRGILDLRRLIP